MTDTTMKKTLIVTLEIELSNMDEAQLKEAGYEPWDDDGDPRVGDYEPREIAECLEGVLSYPETQAEAFAGSAIYANVLGVKLKNAEWSQ